MSSENKTSDIVYDLCIVGGGINGAGIARDAAMRGLSVLLLEAQDLASATSSSSTKLIHGGLRYLEHYEFRLVKEALSERETLMNLAPHIIWPLRFVLPHDKHLRPAWMIRIGLFLYDHLAKRDRLPPSKVEKLADSPLKDTYTKGFSYSDCWVEDSRLVVLNAMSAKQYGADIHTRTACTNASVMDNGYWSITAETEKGDEKQFVARRMINAAGPWVRGFLEQSNLQNDDTPNIRLVKGSHFVIPKLYDGDHCYILQQPDKRIIFTIPYENDFTLVGTTDTEFGNNPPDTASLDEDEADYLVDAVNRSFHKQISKEDLVWSYSGVRPLLDDGDDNASAVTRDYKLILDHHGGAPLLSVFGGKITTYRCLAKDAVDRILGAESEKRFSTTETKPLPGGDIPGSDIQNFIDRKAEIYPFLPSELLVRYVKAYGSLMDTFLKNKQSLDDLGIHYGDNVYEAEIVYLVEQEWAKTVDDIIWRRSKLGLHITEDTAAKIHNHLSVLVKD